MAAERSARTDVTEHDSALSMIRKLGGVRFDDPLLKDMLGQMGLTRNSPEARSIIRQDGLTIHKMMERMSGYVNDPATMRDGEWHDQKDFFDWLEKDTGRREYTNEEVKSRAEAEGARRKLIEETDRDARENQAERDAIRTGENYENQPVEVAPGVRFSMKPLRETAVPVPDETFKRLGISKGNVFADYEALYKKHPDHFESASDVKAHVERVMENPSHILPGGEPDHKLLVRRNGKDRAVAAEVVFRGGKYRVRSAYNLDPGQLETKIEKASQGGGRDSTGPVRNRQGDEIASPGSTVPSDTGSLENPSPEANIPHADKKGKPSQTDTPEFKRWFGDSKVVDKEGKPLVVYHLSDNDFSVFNRERLGDNTKTNTDAKDARVMAELGFWFADKDISWNGKRGMVSARKYSTFLREPLLILLSVSNPIRPQLFSILPRSGAVQLPQLLSLSA